MLLRCGRASSGLSLALRAPASPFGTLSEALIKREKRSAAQTYHPLPVVWTRAKGCSVWDVEGNEYLDFLASYSAVNQGHCHDRLIAAMTEQAKKLDLSSRAFYSDKFGEFAEFATQYFGFDRILPMNSGAEAVETAIKITRKYAYDVRGLPADSAIIIVAQENFHGRTTTIVSFSTDPTARDGFGPYTPGFLSVEYGNLAELKSVFEGEYGPRIAGFLVEPIQGEAGVKIPPPGYLAAARDLCAQHKALFITDEIQSGLGRAGQLLAYCCDCGACQHGGGNKSGTPGAPFACKCKADKKPDLLILGKALSGGIYPISAVLGSHEVIRVLTSGTHGSTFGGNAIAAAIGIEALKVLEEENLVANSFNMGERFRRNLEPLRKLPYVRDVRGRGLFNAIEVVPDATRSAWEICLALAKRGILCKPTHDHIIRLTPPLCITAVQIDRASHIILDVFTNVHQLKDSDLIDDSH